MRWCLYTLGLGSLFGCGTALYVTDQPFDAARVMQLRRGGEQLQCREQTSEEFALFLSCPGKHQAIGFSSLDSKTALTCVDLFPRNCKKLAARVLAAGKQQTARQVPDATP
jgi:hypothetical protein